MARKAGQIIARGSGTWLVRVYLGRDSQTGTKALVAEIDAEIDRFAEGENPSNGANHTTETRSTHHKDKNHRCILCFQNQQCRTQEEDECRGACKNCCRSKGSLGETQEEGLILTLSLSSFNFRSQQIQLPWPRSSRACRFNIECIRATEGKGYGKL
jgi:hypothetical protein